MSARDIRYDVAGPGDFADIAALLAETDMPGWITLSYRADLAAARVMAPGATLQSVIGRADDGRLAGMASRLVLPGYWQGRAQPIGWAAQLRLAQDFRHRPSVLRGGFDAFRQHLHNPDQTPWYMASILSDNRVARRLLERGLPGFPRFTPLMGYHTLAYRPRSTRATPGIRPATPADAPALRAFLNRENHTRPLAPAFAEDEDFAPGRWPGLGIGDWLIATDGSDITAATALWAQAPWRRLVVAGYDRRLARVRWLANLAAPLTGLPDLPPVGASLPIAYLAFFTVAGNDPATARALLAAARAASRRRGIGPVSVGLADDDPLLPVLSRPRHLRYDSMLYGVTWLARETLPAADLFRLAKVEISLL